MDNSIMLGITELRQSVDSGQPLKERLKIAMRSALHHWLITNEEDQFKTAVGAVMVEATEEERELIEVELKFLQALSAASRGIPVNFAVLMEEVQEKKETHELIGLKNLWDEVKAENG